MRFIFRTDASEEIGSGHVMRSSVLAEELISRGFECIFIGSISGLDWVTERISGLKFRQVIADETLFVGNPQTDVLVLDSYSIPVSNNFIAKKNWKFLISICDEITPNYLVDVELRPGFGKILQDQVSPLVLSGPEHILIRQGILKSSRKKAEGGTTRVLVSGGGSDTFGFVPAVAEVIYSLNLNLEVHLFTNEEILTNFSRNFIIHPIGTKLDIVARNVDVALTTASTSSLEFIAREIPTGVVCAVDNQENYYKQLGHLGYASRIGARTSSGGWEFNIEALEDLLRNQQTRDALKKSINGLIDLKGAQRVVNFLLKFLVY